jgi:hypothetical protein
MSRGCAGQAVHHFRRNPWLFGRIRCSFFLRLVVRVTVADSEFDRGGPPGIRTQDRRIKSRTIMTDESVAHFRFERRSRSHSISGNLSLLFGPFAEEFWRYFWANSTLISSHGLLSTVCVTYAESSNRSRGTDWCSWFARVASIVLGSAPTCPANHRTGGPRSIFRFSRIVSMHTARRLARAASLCLR